MEDSRGSHHSFNSQPPGPHSGPDRYSGNPSSKSSSSQQQQHYNHQQQHSHSSYSKEGRSQQQHQPYSSQDPDTGAAWRSPITPTTTRKFNRMAIHEVLDGNQPQHPHSYGHEEDSPPYKRRGGSPEEFSFSDPPGSSSGPSSHQQQQHQHRYYGRGESRHYSDRNRPPSPRCRQESPMPGSNSEDEDDDIRNYKKRRMVPGLALHQKGSSRQHSPPLTTPGAQPEVMDQVRSTLKLKQQQKAIIESRQNSQHGSSMPQQQQQQRQSSPQQQSPSTKPSTSNGNNQPVTETTSSGLSVFHGSASFASLNRRAQPSPKNPKNAKSLTIFAPSYSESSLSIHSAPLQPSQSHQAMSMGLRTSQPLLPRHQHHPYAPHTGSYHQPLQSPRTAGHAKKSSRVTLRQSGQSTSENSSGTLPAPILSSHTGPLPSPMYPPSTPFLSNPKHMFMETVSSLFDSMDSTRSLKHTLEEQVRKSAQLLQTLQASGTMIENLVRGQFKELEKGVIERFEGELEHLNARVRQLEEHQGLTPPPKKTKPVVAASSSTITPPTSSSSSSTAITGVSASLNGVSMSGANSGTASTSGIGEASNHMDASPTTGSHSDSSSNNGTLPTPPLTKSQGAESAMEIEDDHVREPTEYNATVRSLQERVADLEKRKD